MLQYQALLIWIMPVLLFLLLLLPVFAYLLGGWKERRSEILTGMGDEAITRYFKTFHPRFPMKDAANGQDIFRQYYSRQFGRLAFLVPILLLAAIAASLLFWSALSALDWISNRPLGPGHLPALAIAAIMGGYMYATYDMISRWSSSDLSPTDLLWQSFRLVIAVPMAYAISSAFTPAIALTVAFLLGAFPTTEIMKIARRLVAKKLDAGELPESSKSELQQLQGIDLRNAERLACEGITTVLQLAYADPVKLAIRTNLSFSVVVDLISQALLWIYVTEDLPQLARMGLRGAYEIRDCFLNLTRGGEEKQALARSFLEIASKQVKYDPAGMKNIWSQVALDPYTIFLWESWFYEDSVLLRRNQV
jgi:hypothetical protein